MNILFSEPVSCQCHFIGIARQKHNGQILIKTAQMPSQRRPLLISWHHNVGNQKVDWPYFDISLCGFIAAGRLRHMMSLSFEELRKQAYPDPPPPPVNHMMDAERRAAADVNWTVTLRPIFSAQRQAKLAKLEREVRECQQEEQAALDAIDDILDDLLGTEDETVAVDIKSSIHLESAQRKYAQLIDPRCFFDTISEELRIQLDCPPLQTSAIGTPEVGAPGTTGAIDGY